MPELTERSDNQFSNATTSSSYSLPYANGSVSANGFWSKHRADVSYTQLQKFWSELSPLVRRELLRIDKPALCEEARKNMYCSRCNGLVVKGFSQIADYEKSLEQEEEGGPLPCSRLGASRNENNGELCMTAGCQHDFQDPSVHPWGGLTTSRDGTHLTLMDCYLYSESLKMLQKVFDSARARERERELLYPDACGGGGRGWISQGVAGYGRGHGTREACALHNARLSVDTLVDFWSALGEESRQSLLKMKEEDFMEKLIVRFDSKRFCRDCRRNVIREFKELKELKRIRRETRCTTWFCVADTCFQYEVSLDTVQADWHQTFVDAYGTYHHFEWAVGTGEGKSDILEFENVGLSGRVQVNGLDLSGLNACYITLRAWKLDGRCTELSVKAHALKGQQCVHCRLVVGDGFVTIRRGETMRRFFEHAEEAEEEEDDDSMDKDENELDGECSRPQKHAKSPELAREFLLDAATVIFTEQVEKAFRDGTAKQNAHSIFVYLSLKLLEDRIHVACKEIVTNAKQLKLLEEEEKEKREEEERKERRKTKDKEKKLRRKEKLREKDREKKCSDPDENHIVPNLHEEPPSLGEVHDKDLVSETGDTIPSRPASPEIQDEQILNGYISPSSQSHFDDYFDGDFESGKDCKGSFVIDHLNYSRRKPKFRKDFQPDPALRWPDRRRFSESGDTFTKSERRYHGDYINGLNKPVRCNSAKSNGRINGPKFGERYDSHTCSCYQYNEYRLKVEPHCPTTQVGPEAKSDCKLDTPDISRPYYRGTRYNQVDYTRENNGRSKIRNVNGNGPGRDLPHIRRVWEPMESQKKYPRSNSDSDVTLGSKTFKVETHEPEKLLESSIHEETDLKEAKSPQYSKESGFEDVDESPMATDSLNGTRDPFTSSTSNSDSSSSCLSEGDSNGSSSSPQNPESSSTSDSEETSQNSEGKETLILHGNEFPQYHGIGIEKKPTTDGGNLQAKTGQKYDNGKPNASIGSQPQAMFPPLHAQSLHFPIFQAPSMGYCHQNPVSWPAAPPNGILPLAHPNHYVFASPFGYDLNCDSHFVPYGALAHLGPPALNHGQVPVYPPVALKDHSKISRPSGLGESCHHEANLKRAPTAEGGQNGNTGFSLFHFGGPVALSNGYVSNPVPSKEGIVGNLSSNVPVDHIAGDHYACDKKDTTEDYNLFAASNGMRFSFF